MGADRSHDVPGVLLDTSGDMASKGDLIKVLTKVGDSGNVASQVNWLQYFVRSRENSLPCFPRVVIPGSIRWW